MIDIAITYKNDKLLIELEGLPHLSLIGILGYQSWLDTKEDIVNHDTVKKNLYTIEYYTTYENVVTEYADRAIWEHILKTLKTFI